MHTSIAAVRSEPDPLERERVDREHVKARGVDRDVLPRPLGDQRPESLARRALRAAAALRRPSKQPRRPEHLVDDPVKRLPRGRQLERLAALARQPARDPGAELHLAHIRGLGQLLAPRPGSPRADGRQPPGRPPSAPPGRSTSGAQTAAAQARGRFLRASTTEQPSSAAFASNRSRERRLRPDRTRLAARPAMDAADRRSDSQTTPRSDAPAAQPPRETAPRSTRPRRAAPSRTGTARRAPRRLLVNDPCQHEADLLARSRKTAHLGALDRVERTRPRRRSPAGRPRQAARPTPSRRPPRRRPHATVLADRRRQHRPTPPPPTACASAPAAPGPAHARPTAAHRSRSDQLASIESIRARSPSGSARRIAKTRQPPHIHQQLPIRL